MNIRNFIKRLSRLKISFRLPVFGAGCGVLGLTLARVSVDLGKYAARLLKALEYRGYDSTGAIFQDDEGNTSLMKDVGAPSTLVETLGIEKAQGRIFCGQVRWATFGAVDRVNAQPHEVKCKRHLYGAHNGNITNTPELKQFLLTEGHNVLSDNDGEMLVHLIEHYFDNELDHLRPEEQNQTELRRASMRKAIIKAGEKVIGSFAAVVTDPVTGYQYAIKAGSSFYFGVGKIDDNDFALASSDLTAVLRFTKNLVNFRQGEFIEYSATEYNIFTYKKIQIKQLNKPDIVYDIGENIQRSPVRSKLRAEDTELLPQFNYFMEQEIHFETESAGKLVKIFLGGSNTGRRMLNFLDRNNLYQPILELNRALQNAGQHRDRTALFDTFCQSEHARHLREMVPTDYPAIFAELVKEDFDKKYFFSSDKNMFIDLAGEDFDKTRVLVAKSLDSLVEKHDIEDFEHRIDAFVKLVHDTIENSRNIYGVACGTSFHSTKVASMFFNQIAGVEIIPILPGDFRGQYSKCMKEKDVVLGVSQSGETKDLIDVFDDIDKLPLQIHKIVLVNNVNSTLGQEKSDVSLPIFCGPEIAVPATKSYINQLTLFYYLAIKTAEMILRCKKESNADAEEIELRTKEIDRRYKTLLDIPLLIKETIRTTRDQIDDVAGKIYMEPSMHILATRLTGVAKEGALKIRETVLNHTEGGEASEFKHGPNTILGKNTVFGLKSIKTMLKYFNQTVDEVEREGQLAGLPHDEIREITRALSSYMFTRTFPFNLSTEGTALFKKTIRHYDVFNHLYRNYPLIYVTGPEERDINLTISQINTHKIRGADTFVIAEENDKLLENARLNPHRDRYYGWGYIFLPRTGDTLMTAFSSSVVLQLLALRMSVRKMDYLDRLSMIDHGVHPDVPKNVSKSITVD